MQGGALQFLFKTFLLGNIVNDAQHQSVAVDFNRPGIGLHMAGGAIGNFMDKIQRLMPTRQSRNFMHNRQNLATQHIDFPCVFLAHRLQAVAVEIERRQVGVDNQTIS